MRHAEIATPMNGLSTNALPPAADARVESLGHQVLHSMPKVERLRAPA
ncbi:hypothetical protein [Paraburkholderia sp. HD33-4]|nr:hypothetical protein [Paraburkholderia sp. HD33-4]